MTKTIYIYEWLASKNDEGYMFDKCESVGLQIKQLNGDLYSVVGTTEQFAKAFEVSCDEIEQASRKPMASIKKIDYIEKEIKLTKKEINNQLKEIRKTIQWMQKIIDTHSLDELDRSYFEDLMCQSAQLYQDYADDYDPE